MISVPTDALGNFHASVWHGADSCGTTGFHTDDAYIPIRRNDPKRAALVRLWIPLADLSPSEFVFATLNESAPLKAEREAAQAEKAEKVANATAAAERAEAEQAYHAGVAAGQRREEAERKYRERVAN